MSKDKNKKNKSKRNVVLAIVVLFIAFGAFKYFSLQRQMEVRREASQKQQEIMIASWEDQGLSEEEIEKKLEDFRESRVRGEGSQIPTIFRTFRRVSKGHY